MDTKYHDIVENNIESFARELELKILDGWAIDKSNRGDVVGLYGGMYTITVSRNYETVERLRKNAGIVQEAPKLTPAESLAKARAARAAGKGK